MIMNYEMSDDEFLNKGIPNITDNDELVLDGKTDEANKSDETDTDTTHDLVGQSQAEFDEQEQTDDTDTKVDDTDDTDETDESDDTQANDDSTDDVDYEAFYRSLTAPMKANGREITLTSADDIKALVQQGANYSKKMAGLKPHMAILKTLEQHGLTDESKISYLIDLHNKDPKAIAKLVQEANLDVYSMDFEEEANNYVNIPKVQQINLIDEVISELSENSESFAGLLTHIQTNWDNTSKEIATQNPQLLKVLDTHKQLGIYDKIVDKIEYERMLGRLGGMSFIEAYHALEAPFLDGGLHKNSFTGTRPKKQDNNNPNKLKAKSPKHKTKTNEVEFDPLKISDEELERYMAQHNYH